MATTDLIRYVAEEIAADGPEGSSWERLNGFIDDYSNRPGTTSSPDQIIDKDLRTYIIESLAQLPNLLPGRFVPGVKASNTKAKTTTSKGKRKQADDSEESEDEVEEVGKVVSSREALNKTLEEEDHVEVQDGDKERSLQELRLIYGSDLRLVADAASIRDSLGNVDDCLQSVRPLLHYILRSRGEGISFPEIGDKFKFNVSLIFFQVKILVNNNVAAKFRAHNGRVLVSWVVAKRYAHLCPSLNDSNHDNLQEDDDVQDNNEGVAGNKSAPAEDDLQLQEMSSEAVNELLRGGKKSRQNVSEEEDEEADLQEEDIDQGEEESTAGQEEDKGLTTLHGLLAYPGLPTRSQQKALMQDRSMVRFRILKLLKSSKNNATIRIDLILRIGVKEPDRLDRKIFNASLRQLEREEMIERCLLKRPLHNKKDHTEQCWMATAKGIAEFNALISTGQQKDIVKKRQRLQREIESSKSKVIVETSFARQLLESVDRYGAAGTTIDQLTTDLGGNRDRHRDLDHMLSVLKKPVNKYYSDYTIFSALEQSGRIRSQRFWTRRWRPNRLAPQEFREMPPDQLSNWIGLPGEKSYLTIDQWRKRMPENPKVKVIKRDKEEDDDDLEKTAPKKVKINDVDGVKGRPRKDFSKKAEKAAKIYQEKKAQREREKEEQLGVESLLGESLPAGQSRIMRKRKARDVPYEVDRGFSTMEGQEDDQFDEQEQQSEQSSKIIDAPRSHGEHGTMYIDSALATLSTMPTTASKSPNKPLRASQAPRNSINLTLQLKYDALVQFFQEKEIVEGSHFEHEYRKKIRNVVGQNGDTQQYEMDRKVRNKLFHSLEKAGMIQCKKLAAPIMSKGPQRIVWHNCNIEESKLIAFCRQVSQGTIRPLESWASAGGKQHAVLDSHQVDAPESFFAGTGMNFDFEAKNLDEFLSNDRVRNALLRNNTIRGQYTGRLPGLGARLYYLHRTMIELIDEQDDWTFDLAWWASEATLGQYLKLAFPPTDETIMEASQDDDLTKLPIKDVSEELLRALHLNKGGDGCHKTLKPLLEYLGVFGLVEPVTLSSKQSGGEATLTYRFSKEGVFTGWDQALQLQRAAEPFDFAMPFKVEQYWQQVTNDCVSMQTVNLDELPLLQANLYNALIRKAVWSHTYRLLKEQQAFFKKTISLGVDRSVLDDPELLLRISKASLTPVNILKRYYQRNCLPEQVKKQSNRVDTVSSESGSKVVRKPTGTGEVVLPGTSLTARQANAIRRKALEVQRGRLAEFDQVVETCFGELEMEDSSRKVILEGLSNIRREYGKGEAGLTLKRVRIMFDDVMKLHKEGGEQKWSTIVNQRKSTRAKTATTDDPDGKKKKKKEPPKPRKAAIEWTKLRDELLRDAVVILRCRDRHRNPTNPQKNWKALEQIFPDPSANSLKSRFDVLCKAVGEEAYLSQLEAEWEKLWATHRGTDELDDSNSKSPTEFDLMDHITFLRTHINKLAVADKVDNETGDPLPLDVGKMFAIFDYERPPGCDNYDAYSTLTRFSLAEESVEKRRTTLRGRAFTLGFNAMFSINNIDTKDDQIKKQIKKDRGIATALVKIIQCTSEPDYSKEVATRLWSDNAEDEMMNKVIKELLDLKIIKRITKEDREVPNRSYVFTPEYNNFHQITTLETLPFWEIAKGYQKIVKEGQAVVFRQSENEETAAYLTLLSQDQIKVETDLTVVEKIKMDKLFNAKLIHDHMLEIPIHLRLKSSSSRTDSNRRSAALLNSQPSQETVLQWLDLGTDSLSIRVDKVWKQWIASLRGDKQMLAKRLDSIFHNEDGENGISKEDLKVLCQSKHLKPLLQAAQGFSPPLIFQFGYEETLLISSRYLPSWTIRFESGSFAFPYKWFDIHGQWNRVEWTQALRLLLHAIITRPGITLTQLLLQFRIALDRTEVNRLIQEACEAGVIRKILSYNEQVQASDAEWEAKNDTEVALIVI